MHSCVSQFIYVCHLGLYAWFSIILNSVMWRGYNTAKGFSFDWKIRHPINDMAPSRTVHAESVFFSFVGKTQVFTFGDNLLYFCWLQTTWWPKLFVHYASLKYYMFHINIGWRFQFLAKTVNFTCKSPQHIRVWT